MTREEALNTVKAAYAAARNAAYAAEAARDAYANAFNIYSAELARIDKEVPTMTNKPTPTDPVTARAKLGALRIAAEQAGILNDQEAPVLIATASPIFAAAYDAVRDRLRATETTEVAE
jgi:hypothetical protein